MSASPVLPVFALHFGLFAYITHCAATPVSPSFKQSLSSLSEMTLFLHFMHRVQQSCLASRNSPLCPVRITKLFFHRFGLHMGADQNDESFISFRLRRQSARLLPVRNSVLSLSQATGDACVPFAVIQIPRQQTRHRK